jgi:hypothetical protein
MLAEFPELDRNSRQQYELLRWFEGRWCLHESATGCYRTEDKVQFAMRSEWQNALERLTRGRTLPLRPVGFSLAAIADALRFERYQRPARKISAVLLASGHSK